MNIEIKDKSNATAEIKAWREENPGMRLDLENAYLRNANLESVTMNWHGYMHELVAERLRQAAGHDTKRHIVASLIGYSGARNNWCWEDFAKIHVELAPILADEIEWALKTMAKWVKDGDKAPDILREYADKLKEGGE